MIDIRTEELLTLSEAAGSLPRRRLGRRPDVSTLHRWVTRGLRGVRLEAVQVGGCRCTSREALQRFFDRLDGVAASPTGPDLPELVDDGEALLDSTIQPAGARR